MDRLNGTIEWGPVSLITATGMNTPPGGVVLAYENTSGIDQLVTGYIELIGITGGAINVYELYATQETAISGVLASVTKINAAHVTIPIFIPKLTVLAGNTLTLYVFSDNAGDTSESGTISLNDAQTGIDVLSVGGNTPAVPPTNWSDMVISAAGKIKSGFTRLF